ncbi:armadillo-type protein [Mycotypha africana]|uniref:armadillo-type protein n=1 Tax=Mycotypha africana TaxID=64632 RepID=UPI002300D7A8|nr:armadillo-type protein [Mycotypha africana]KAI8973333.1 armadillo-type protein [Mycotypha africana]
MNRAQDPGNVLIHKQFEEACLDFQVPATRAAGEQVLTEFRQITKVLPVCQYILEHASNPMVQFQVALAIGDVAVRDYTQYEKSDLLNLKNYLIDFCLKREELMKYVRDQLVLAVALITKRSLFDVTDQDRQNILAQVKQLIQMDNDNAQVFGLALSNALIDQFSNTKSTTIGLTWEHHHNCKLFFESNILLGLFEELMTKLHRFVSQVQHLPDNVPATFTEMIIMLEKILHWEFESTNTTPNLPGTFARNAADTLDDEFDREDGPSGSSAVRKTYTLFPKAWQAALGNPDVLWLIFMTYSLAQDDDVLSHRCRQCLIQLAGLQCNFFDNDTAMIQSYAATMIHGLRKMMSDITTFGTSPDALSEQGPQMLGCIQMIRRLLENVPIVILCAIPDFFQFLNEVGMITVGCLGGTVIDVDEGWISESCDESLQTWVKLADIVRPTDLREADPKAGLPQEQIQHLTDYMTTVAFQIVESYINTRLERAKMVLEDEEEEDEIDAALKDWDTFADQLTCIGTLGRFNPQPCLLKLHQLLSERFETFKGFFNNGNNPATTNLILLHEQLHWIILISAHILADSGKGEQPMIPDALMQLSGSVPLDQDPIVSLSNLFLELFRFSSSFSSSTVEASNCSPRVAETLIWYIERWSKSYLLMDENEYGYTSPNIAKAFGRPGPSDGQGLHVIDFFIEQMKLNFILWNADPDVLQQLVQWLHSCGTTNNLKQGLLRSAHYQDLVQFVTHNLEQLPEAVHSSLVQTIATISSYAVDETTRTNYFGLMFKMIEDRISSVLHRPDFQQVYQRGEIINNVINALEMFDGLALACQYSNTQTIFGFSARFFDSFIQLMSLYKSVPEVQIVILQLFADLSSRLDLGVLNEGGQKQVLFRTIMELLKIFGECNQGKKRLHSQEEEEDRPYADIFTVLVMLSNLLASGHEDLSKSNSSVVIDDGVAEVVLYGINIVIPMINMEMLKLPNLCQQYIQLISYLVEMCPDKLLSNVLPPALFNNIMASLEYGIGHDISDINILTLHAIAPLTLYCIQHQQSTQSLLKQHLEKLLQQLLNLLLFQHLDTNIIDAASEALLGLICVQKDIYMVLANQIMSQQSNEIQSRLLLAFQKLDQATPQPNVQLMTANKQPFKEALLAFLMDVRAVLRVK